MTFLSQIKRENSKQSRRGNDSRCIFGRRIFCRQTGEFYPVYWQYCGLMWYDLTSHRTEQKLSDKVQTSGFPRNETVLFTMRFCQDFNFLLLLICLRIEKKKKTKKETTKTNKQTINQQLTTEKYKFYVNIRKT